MKVDIQDVSSCKKTLRIEIPLEDVNTQFEKTYEEVRKTVEVPGFRKGRAPRNILKMRFGEYVKSEVFESLVPPAYEKAVEDAGITVLGSPDIYPPSGDILFSVGPEFEQDLDNNIISVELQQEFLSNNAPLADGATITIEEKGNTWLVADDKNKYRLIKGEDKLNVYSGEIWIKEGEPLIFEATVNVKPAINIPDYSTLEIEKSDVDVKKEDVDAALQQMREEKADFIPIEEDREIRDGDFAGLDITLRHNEELIDQGKDQTVEVKQDGLIPEFYQSLLGMKPGEEKDFNATFPEDYYSKSLAGKDIAFHIVLNKIMERRLPELDDDFAKDQNEENLERLTAKVWNALIEQRRYENRTKMKQELIDQLIEKTQFEVSDSIIEEQVKALTRGIEDRNKISDDDMSKYRALALDIIRRSWLINDIIRNENISVSDEELEAEVRHLAESKNRDPQKYMSQLKAINRLESIRDGLKEEKAFDLLIEKASVKRGLIV